MPYRWLAAALLLLWSTLSFGQAVLNVSSWLPPDHLLSQTQLRWCELLEQKSAGQVRCRMLPRPAAPAPGTFDAVGHGLADLSFTVHGYTPARFELTQMAELPLLGDQAEAVSVAFQRTVSRTPALMAEHQGVKLIAVFTHGPGLLLNTRRPVTRLEDLVGLRLRAGGGMAAEIAKALGISVALKPPQESLALLSSGALDGTLCPAEAVESFAFAPAVRHGTLLPGGLFNTSFALVMNQAKYDALPAAAKKAVDEIDGEIAARMFGRAWDSADRSGMSLLQAYHVRWVKADGALVEQVRERTAPLEQRWTSAARAKGVKEPERLLEQFRAEVQRLER